MVNLHSVEPVECLAASRAFAHAVGNAVVDARAAEQVAAGLQDPVFEVVSAHRAQCESLEVMLARLSSTVT